MATPLLPISMLSEQSQRNISIHYYLFSSVLSDSGCKERIGSGEPSVFKHRCSVA